MLTNREYTIIHIEKVDSTSMYVAREKDVLDNFSVIIADEQSDGRGQGNHIWHSAPGENLTFSILVKYDNSHILRAVEQQVLTMASSLAAVDFLKDEFNIFAEIKKPNDIYVKDKKICGILIENGLKGQNMEWSIVGMGINLNQLLFPKYLPNPVSIAQLTGKQYNTKKCLKFFLRHFSTRFDAIWTEREALKKEYDSKLISLTK